ncbi:hypothetical protein SAMN05192539_104934 [Paraburkholderia diazotrophica]|uniref:Uncharacterized protein n=1 Tax=Paraburkholderia diazotrophica TaxID=667676 RepID=A0A1H7EB63_9BURK|nr:hypothetical protein SAMN05192539_104934 [Paraburkholderia diazotrophica]
MTDTQLLTYEPAPGRSPARARGEAPDFIELPKPDMSSGAPLMKALALRESRREFSSSTTLPLIWCMWSTRPVCSKCLSSNVMSFLPFPQGRWRRMWHCIARRKGSAASYEAGSITTC